MKHRFLLINFCLILGLHTIISAQNQRSVDNVPPEHPAGCRDTAESADYYFRYRKFRSYINRAEKTLKKAIAECAERPENKRLQNNLTIVQEELASKILTVALYYLNRYHTGSGGLIGACSRLNQIIKNYPRFSKTEQVLMLLGKDSDCKKLSLAEGETESDSLK